MHRHLFLFLSAASFSILLAFFPVSLRAAESPLPPVTGSPVIDQPPILNWPRDRKPLPADISDPSADTLSDLHGVLRGRSCRAIDLLLSTEGNYYMALRELANHILRPGRSMILRIRANGSPGPGSTTGTNPGRWLTGTPMSRSFSVSSGWRRKKHSLDCSTWFPWVEPSGMRVPFPAR